MSEGDNNDQGDMMNFNRLARAGGLLAAVLAMLASFMPAASAHGVGTVVFLGDAQLSAPLGFPCAPTPAPTTGDPTTPTKGAKECPPNVKPCPNGATNCINKKGKILDTGGNTRAGTFRSTVCIGVAVNGPDKNKPTVQGPGCAIQASFIVTGYCGLSQGSGNGTSTISGQTIFFKFTWVDPGGGNLLILGNWWKSGGSDQNPEGDLVSVVKAVPIPGTTTPGTTLTNSCSGKTATTFTIAGGALLVHPKCLPGHNPDPIPACLLP